MGLKGRSWALNGYLDYAQYMYLVNGNWLFENLELGNF